MSIGNLFVAPCLRKFTMRRFSFSFGTSSVALGAILLVSRATFAEAPSPPEGFRALFNRNDLSGWYGHNPHDTEKIDPASRNEAIVGFQKDFLAHWRVEEGELVN